MKGPPLNPLTTYRIGFGKAVPEEEAPEEQEGFPGDKYAGMTEEAIMIQRDAEDRARKIPFSNTILPVGGGSE